ncbi:MAG: hypothetical protein CVU00_11845 [Bacteroidetes bacterium HGW-Bacteroidetes-17]|jgi:hypothetical protein|nr:MAG: hypothetical protein CVU00_11845 [Bacteroidetes bacterium HGW-Bacteroidetes-17]
MKNLISVLVGLLTLLSGFHFYLNITNETEISIEKTIATLKTNFIEYPIKTTSTILLIVLISSIVTYLVKKIFNDIAYREKRRDESIQRVLHDYSKRDEIKDSLFDKYVNRSTPYNLWQKKPWNRLHPGYSKVIIRDIRDKSFPEYGNWSKTPIFNFTKEGIEFFNLTNTTGFDLYMNDRAQWDVSHIGVSNINSKKYSLVKEAYCIDFLPYEDILHVDWEQDEYYGLHTFFCHYKYKKNGVRHPFKEIRYYIFSNDFLTQLENTDKRNFKPLSMRIKIQIMKPYRRIRKYFKYRKYYH